MSKEKILLNVPVQHQPNESLECSVTALKMLMDYWNDDVPYDTLVDELSEWVNEKERHVQGLGIYLANRGYEVWFKHHDTNVVSKEIEDITETGKNKLVDALGMEKESVSNYRKKKLSLDIAYIEAGGHYSNAIPTLELLDKNLEQKLPTIICTSVRVLRSNPEKRGNHYVVVIGKDGDDYILNDPNPKVTSPYKTNKDKLCMAWYLSGTYTLTARPK